ncbi:MAG: HEAT repeat domain-containing protein [Lentisphaerae bacterium]|nr:HEAT repeat domain-containing protein [Lentisphaerota bacterium]
MAKKLVIVVCIVCLVALMIQVGQGRQARQRIDRLNNANPAIQNRAIAELGTLGRRQAAPALKKFLSGDYARDTRLLTLKALGDIGDPESVAPIVPVLADPDPQIKLSAAEALGKIRDPTAIQPLAKLLNDPDAQLATIWALGNIGHTNAVSFLSGLLASPDKFVRFNALQALKKIGSGT